MKGDLTSDLLTILYIFVLAAILIIELPKRLAEQERDWIEIIESWEKKRKSKSLDKDSNV